MMREYVLEARRGMQRTGRSNDGVFGCDAY
jgi:hypothetical protein